MTRSRVHDTMNHKTSRLALVLITYNRAPFLKKTLDAILAETSPVRDCPLTILDNHSTDGSGDVIRAFIATHTNIRHVIHPFNVGGNANIAKALECCQTPYHWILCDDDVYDWTHWTAVEEAMSRGERLLCVGDRHLPPASVPQRNDSAQLLQQMTFLPSIIYGPGAITDTALRNAYDYTYALFPHLAPVIMHLNAGGRIWVSPHAIVRPGEYGTDISYSRGFQESQIFPIGRTMTLAAGFAYLTDCLTDRRLAKRAFATLVFGSQMGRIGFYGEIFARLRGRAGEANFHAILRQSPWITRSALRLLRLVQNSPLYTLVMNPRIYSIVRRLADWRNRRVRLANHSRISPHA